jgi:hypothetical protein
LNGSPIASKFAFSGVVFSWLAWFLSHIEEINRVLQFFALLFAIAASIAAYRYHTRKPK